MSRYVVMLKKPLFPHLLAVVFFCILTVGMTWPLPLRLATHTTPGQQPAMSVTYLGLWTLAWNHHYLRGEATSYWDANHLYPHQKTLAYSEPQFGIGLLTFPVVLFGGNTILAYNVAVLLFFWGAGVGVYALCWWLFGALICPPERCVASLTAGILYAFTPYMFEQIAVIQLLATLFAPLCLLGFHRLCHQRSWWGATLFVVSFLGCWYTCAYYGLFLSVFLACFPFVFLQGRSLGKQDLILGSITVAVLIVCLLPLANGISSAKAALSFNRDETLIRDLSPVFMMYFFLPSSNLLYEHILGLGLQGYSLFLGGMLCCLSLIGVITVFRSPAMVSRDAESRKTPARCLQIRPSLRRCGIFYTAMAFVAFLLSLGMNFTPIHTDDLGVYRIIAWLSPYHLLYKFVPGFSIIRSPARFSIFLALFLAILAGVGMLWVYRRIRPRWRWGFIPLLISITIFELWPAPLRFVKVAGAVDELPPIYQQMRKLPPETVLIEFPLTLSPSEQGKEASARQMYFSTFYWYRLVDGYSSFAPKAHADLVNVLRRSDIAPALSALGAFGVEYVVAHWDEMNAQEKRLLRGP